MTSLQHAEARVPAPGPDLPIADLLLGWYDRHRRDLPWRSPPGTKSDPYTVWLSEIMLQQTTVAAVKPYFAAFLAAWPTVEALATTPLESVLKAWAGLGYYSRARNLHACALLIMDRFGGRFPDAEHELRGLPGVGAYTAAAISAIAFGNRAVVVDGNVERVMARLHAVDSPMPRARPVLRAHMDAATPARRAGDFAQAVMDLGATICTPKSPACAICPVIDPCVARRLALQSELPIKASKKPVPCRSGAVFFVRRADGKVMVRSRPNSGLFGGMTEFPSTPWIENRGETSATDLPRGVSGPLTSLGAVDHGLTHFQLTLQIFAAHADEPEATTSNYRWVSAKELKSEALPTLMKKVMAAALAANA